jgi:hypothetical protein
MLDNDPAAQAELLDALAVVQAVRMGMKPGEVKVDTRPAVLCDSLAQLVGVMADEVDHLGGDSAGLLLRLYAAVTPASDREFEDG